MAGGKTNKKSKITDSNLTLEQVRSIVNEMYLTNRDEDEDLMEGRKFIPRMSKAAKSSLSEVLKEAIKNSQERREARKRKEEQEETGGFKSGPIVPTPEKDSEYDSPDYDINNPSLNFGKNGMRVKKYAEGGQNGDPKKKKKNKDVDNNITPALAVAIPTDDQIQGVFDDIKTKEEAEKIIKSFMTGEAPSSGMMKREHYQLAEKHGFHPMEDYFGSTTGEERKERAKYAKDLINSRGGFQAAVDSILNPNNSDFSMLYKRMLEEGRDPELRDERLKEYYQNPFTKHFERTSRIGNQTKGIYDNIVPREVARDLDKMGYDYDEVKKMVKDLMDSNEELSMEAVKAVAPNYDKKHVKAEREKKRKRAQMNPIEGVISDVKDAFKESDFSFFGSDSNKSVRLPK